MWKNNNQINYIIFLAIILAGAYLRIYQINFDDYWFDEYVSFWISDPNLSFGETLKRSYDLDYGTNLLFNISLKYFFKIFNYEPQIGRFFPAIFGILSIPLVGYLSYQFDKSKSYLFTTFLISINWYLISYSQETRSFSLSFFLSVLSIIFFIKIYDQNILKINRFLYGFLYIFFSYLGVVNHIFIFIILLAQFLFLLIINYKNKKNISFPAACIFTILIMYFITMWQPLMLQVSIKNYWISQIEIDFFINYYFSRFFGSKIMGAIYLVTLIYLIFNFKNKFFIYSNKYLFLLLLLFLSYFLPIFYGFIFMPILTDRYIIFVLIPILLLISIFTFNLENTKIKKIILFIIIVSTISNNYLEIFKREHAKPEFNKTFENISKTNFHYIYLKASDELNKNLLTNYIKSIKNFDNKKFIILDSNKNIEQNEIWLVCYKAINNFDCSPGKEFDSFSLKKKINYHLIEATLYSL